MTMTIDGSNGITFPSTYIQADVAIGSSSSAQTWQNVKASRAFGTTYTNSTGRPIQVIVACAGANGIVYATVAGVTFQIGYSAVSISDGIGSFIVPTGSTYSITWSSTMNAWTELR